MDDLDDGSLRQKIAALPGSAGWWRSTGEDTFNELADDLVTHGYTRTEALELLDTAYGAVAGEFGS